MRIPPSVIVMSLLTAVPFALAFRDASRGRDKAAHHHDDYDEDDFGSRDSDDDRDLKQYAASEASMERIRAEQREQKAKTELQRARITPQLVGSEPASLGTLFAGVKLGA